MRNRPGSSETYSAYSEDIAVVHLYWDTPAVLQFERAARLGWIDYISQVTAAAGATGVTGVTTSYHRWGACLVYA